MLMNSSKEFEENANLNTTANVGALPLRMRLLNLERTGPFLHSADHKKTLFFKCEGQEDRSFTILLAVARKADDFRMDRNGIAIIDNDNWAVIADECYAQPSGVRGASNDQKIAYEGLDALSWAEFGHFVRNQPRFRSNVAEDITTESATPAPGNFDNLVQLGLRAGTERDARSDLLRSIDAAGDYSFPRTNRKAMINEILMHPNISTPTGKRFSWDVRMNFNWDQTGHIADGGHELDAEMDKAWLKALKKDTKILTDACDNALALYLADTFCPLEMDDAECVLEQVGRRGGFVTLTAFNGASLEFTSHSELGRKLTEMNDDSLMNLWAAIRILDSDFCRTNRAFAVQLELNEARHSFEDVILEDLEPELSF